LNGCFGCETYLAERSRFITPLTKKVCIKLAEKYMQTTLKKSTYMVSNDIESFTKELEIWKKEEKIAAGG